MSKSKDRQVGLTIEVLEDENLCASAKILYAHISNLCNQEGYCFATNGYFADKLKAGERTVRGWLKQLEEGGHIQARYDGRKRQISVKSYPQEETARTCQKRRVIHNSTSKMAEFSHNKKDYDDYINNTSQCAREGVELSEDEQAILEARQKAAGEETDEEELSNLRSRLYLEDMRWAYEKTYQD